MMARTQSRALVERGRRLISRLASASGMPSIGTHNGKFHCDEVSQVVICCSSSILSSNFEYVL